METSAPAGRDDPVACRVPGCRSKVRAAMASRVLRVAIAASFALVLFVLARPASAATAPFCDDRGASAIAAPPVLEAPDDAIRRASVVSCDTEERLLEA